MGHAMPTVISTLYKLELTNEEFDAIFENDINSLADDTLWNKLNSISEIEKTDYDSGLGPEIRYEVPFEFDKPELHEKVMKTIQEHINGNENV